MAWHLPTIAELCKYVIWISVFDLLVFFYAGTKGERLPLVCACAVFSQSSQASLLTRLSSSSSHGSPSRSCSYQ